MWGRQLWHSTFLRSLPILFVCYFGDSSKGGLYQLSVTFYRAGPRNIGNKSKFAMIEKIGIQSWTENSWLKGEKKTWYMYYLDNFFLMLLRCRGEVLLSTCASSIFRFDVLVTPQDCILVTALTCKQYGSWVQNLQILWNIA